MQRHILLLLLLTSYAAQSTMHSATLSDLRLRIAHDTIIDGQYQHYTLHTTIAIAAGTTLTLCNAVITPTCPLPFIMEDSTSRLVLTNTTLTLDKDIMWTEGTLSFKECCVITGPHCFHYSSSAPCTIESESTLILNNECEFYYNPQTPTNTGFIFSNRSSTLMLTNASLRSGFYGLHLTQGTILIAGECSVSADNPNPRFGIVFGSGTDYSDNVKFILSTQHSRLIVQSPHFFTKKKSKSAIALIAKKIIDVVPALISFLGIYSMLTVLETPATKQ